MPSESSAAHEPLRRGNGARLGTALLNAVRGGLVGLAEVIPGVSGGTIALITGIYGRIIAAASHVLVGLKRFVLGPDRRTAKREFGKVDWWLIIPVLLGMIVAVVSLAGVMEHFVTADPELSRGLFFGLVAVSIIVPLRMLPAALGGVGTRIGEVTIFLAAAILAFLLIGFADGGVVADPPLWIVFFAAAVAVCALIVPGVSGSFFLLAIGLYAPTLRAVDERDLGYLGVFALGAVVGLATIVQLIQWLLEHHRRITLLAMAGLMLGSLRALWPWQESRSGETDGVGVLLAPTGDVWGPMLLALLGAAIVIILLALEARIQRRSLAPE